MKNILNIIGVCCFILALFSCQHDSETDHLNNQGVRTNNHSNNEKQSPQLPENVLMQVGFRSKTTTYTKLAGNADNHELDEDAQHFVMSVAVPVVRQDKQLFQIFKDGTYELVISIETPNFNPARKAFRDEVTRNDWELGKLVINSSTITAYNTSGGVIFVNDNSSNPFFKRLVNKIMSDSYFASHVNIGNALFRVSGGAENFLNPKLLPFFLGSGVTPSTQDGLLIFKENIAEKMRYWGHVETPDPILAAPLTNPQKNTSRGRKSTAREDPTESHTLEETEQMIDDTVASWNSSKNVNDINVYTAIDSTKNEIAAEVVYAGDQQMLGVTFFEIQDNEEKTIKTAYTEDYETNPTYDLNMINVESIEYSDVQIVNPLKTDNDDE